MKIKLTRILSIILVFALLFTVNASSTATSAAATSRTATSTTATQAAKGKVKVTVNCRHAVEYGAEDVPQDGVIIDTEADFSSGDTAMSVLKKALESSDIPIDESHGYIKEIAGLNEKECGGSSGWMYIVNSDVPMTSADKFTVSSGDTITFYYITNYGDTV